MGLHILRVDMANGLHLEFGFEDAAKAEEAMSRLTDVGNAKAASLPVSGFCLLVDDHGRRARIDASAVVHQSVVDLDAELAGQRAIALRQIAAKAQIEREAQAAMQRVPGSGILRAMPMDAMERGPVISGG